MIHAFTGPEADLGCHHSVAIPKVAAHPALGGKGLIETADELEILGRDRLRQDEETCKVLRENARRLRDLDQGRSRLRIAATEPVSDRHSFPAPSGLRSDGKERAQ